MMFTHGKLMSGRRAGYLMAAGMLLALSVLVMLFRVSDTGAAAAYVEEESVQHGTVYLLTEGAVFTGYGSPDMELEEGQAVEICLGGAVNAAAAQAETVAQLLERLEVELSPLDMVTVDLSADPIEISVDSEVILYEQEQQITKSSITYVDNDILPTWCETVLQQGQDGVDTKTYEVVFSAGAEVSRQLVEETSTEATATVIERGTLTNFAPNDAQVADIVTNEDGTGVITLANGQQITFNQKLTMKATAYSAGDPGVGTITATGTTVRVGTVAVDRRQIPYGTKMYVVSNDGAYCYGFSIAEDTGGAIKNNRIDLYFNTQAECIQFGVRNCTVYILD